jgi:hypothetical protein
MVLVKDEKKKIKEISDKLKLHNIYFNCKSPFFFKRSINIFYIISIGDRFYHRKKYLFLFGFLIFLNLNEFIYTLIRIYIGTNDQEVIYSLRIFQK